jgi:hypothetical protein
MSDRCNAERHRRKMERHHLVAIVERADYQDYSWRCAPRPVFTGNHRDWVESVWAAESRIQAEIVTTGDKRPMIQCADGRPTLLRMERKRGSALRKS